MRSRSRSRFDLLSRQGDFRRRTAPATAYISLAMTLALSFTFGILHKRWVAHYQPDPVLAGARTVLFPFQYATAVSEASLLTSVSWLIDGKKYADENVRLRAELSRLKMQNQSLAAKAADADRLRTEMGFAEKKGSQMLPAEVIGLRPSALFDTIVIARGTRDGVGLGAVARTPDGLLGQVSDLSAVSAQVMLLTDVNSGVGARVQRGGKVQGVGIVQGSGRNRPLQIVYLRREDDIRPGDKVVSSGYGGVVPADIPIGTVVSVTEDRARFLKSAAIRPAAALNEAREVFLLR